MIIKQKAPGAVAWGFLPRVLFFKDALSLSVGVTETFGASSQACRMNNSNAILNIFHYNRSNHLSRAIVKQQTRSYNLIVFNNNTI
jgi:hypothetical protein